MPTTAPPDMLTSVPQTVAIAAGAGLITVLDYRLLLLILTASTATAFGYLLIRKRADPTPMPGAYPLSAGGTAVRPDPRLTPQGQPPNKSAATGTPTRR